jgi:tetratricopeptide (TPR) repeat protein
MAMPPGELPAASEPQAVFLALAEMESVGRQDAAAAGYAAMVARWPDAADGYFGLGNLALASSDFAEAEAQFRRAVSVSRGAHIPARNNLAMALLGRGCAERALAEVDAALTGMSPDDPLWAAVSGTRQEALGALTEGGKTCE